MKTRGRGEEGTWGMGEHSRSADYALDQALAVACVCAAVPLIAMIAGVVVMIIKLYTGEGPEV